MWDVFVADRENQSMLIT